MFVVVGSGPAGVACAHALLQQGARVTMLDAGLDLIPYSARRDGLEGLFPLYSDDPNALKTSRQADSLLRDLEAARARLNDHGVSFGASRLAVDASCVYCGLCIYGCPYGYIYNSTETLDRLREHPGFTYRPG